mmetsp:Transcript_43690/g.69871  ORF Transcript_43690/g.69871 Transcript_43690/m.69871 type:complete len:160 (-) Transcript_43690:1016-1495(-)
MLSKIAITATSTRTMRATSTNNRVQAPAPNCPPSGNTRNDSLFCQLLHNQSSWSELSTPWRDLDALPTDELVNRNLQKEQSALREYPGTYGIIHKTDTKFQHCIFTLGFLNDLVKLRRASQQKLAKRTKYPERVPRYVWNYTQDRYQVSTLYIHPWFSQ